MGNNEDIPLNEQALRYLNKAKNGYEAAVEEFGMDSRETAILRDEIRLGIDVWDRRIQWSDFGEMQQARLSNKILAKRFFENFSLFQQDISVIKGIKTDSLNLKIKFVEKFEKLLTLAQSWVGRNMHR